MTLASLDRRRVLIVLALIALVALAVIVVNMAVATGHTAILNGWHAPIRHVLADGPNILNGWH